MNASIHPLQVASGNRRISEAGPVGQGVQPQPPERHPPQRVREGWGEPKPVGPRQRARLPQQPSGLWGAEPRRRAQARLPAVGSGEAGVVSEANQGRASSPAPQAKQPWARSDQGGAAPTAGSRACAAPPEPAVRRVLEAAGREGVAGQADRASSPGSTRESPLGDRPNGPASCGAWSGARRPTLQTTVRDRLGRAVRTAGTKAVRTALRRRRV